MLLAAGALGMGWVNRSIRRDPPIDPPDVAAPPPPASLAVEWLEDPPRSLERFSIARMRAKAIDPSAVPRLVEWLDPAGGVSVRRRGVDSELAYPRAPAAADRSRAVRVEYSLDEALTEDVFEIFRSGRVARGLAIVLDPRSGRLLAYASTDPDALPPDGVYPAASIVKVLTAAALLRDAPREADAPCVYRGNKYRLNRRRLERPVSGREATLEQALANSNNQCFSQWAVHALGEDKLRATFDRFGWLSAPAPGHDPGRVDDVDSKFDLGRMGSGLYGVHINPLHVAALSSILTDGRWIEPWWIDRAVDSHGRSLAIPPRAESRRVLSREVADRLRSMMVATTKAGTARSAFRTRRGRPLLGQIEVAGKTGNLTSGEPFGRYEWFLGLAPAENPTIAVVVLQLQSNLWFSRSSELAARVLHRVFCDAEGCQRSLSDRFTGDLSAWTDPLLISELERPLFISRRN